ncbi:hypothetical protein JEY40_26570 [Bradyrhizobium japonicum]|uniref:hypothetical protein n=1 Tax=Bradyrhizobium japonicum TaxID=375 RepID=UPI00200CCCD9|nr:hypothetical protein [Bradyrhizobium japonicum]UQD69568.1 hypothetical protein JEY40_26570 [Bradyrhizobium japonicum]
MKTSALNSLLDECRASKSSEVLAAAVDRVAAAIGGVRAERAKLDGQLQDAIVGGGDTGKVHAAIAGLDQQLKDLEAAETGFTQRRDELVKLEAAAELQALRDRHALETEQVAAHAKRLRAATDELWRIATEGEKLVRQHDRTVGDLESLGERRLQRAAAVLRTNIGERPAPSSAMGFSEYGKQVFTLLSQILALNPANLMRARLTRRQNGRLGATFEAKDHATEAYMDQVRNIRAGN